MTEYPDELREGYAQKETVQEVHRVQYSDPVRAMSVVASSVQERSARARKQKEVPAVYHCSSGAVSNMLSPGYDGVHARAHSSLPGST
jgi:hypothetical protein